jgi:hypothetical protein
VGVLPLLALLFVSYSRSEYKKVILFAGIAAVMALLLAMGRHTPVYKLIYLLPGFDRFRAPSKILILWAFATGLLAGAGVDQFLKGRTDGSPWRLRILAIGIPCLLIIDAAFHYQDSFVLDFFSPFILKEAIPGKMDYAINLIRGEFHQFALLAFTGFLIIFLLRRKLLSVHAGGLCLCALLLLDLACAYGPTIKPENVYRTMEDIKKGTDQSLGKDKSVYRVGSFMHPLGGNLEMYLGYQTVNGYTALFPARYYEYCSRFAEDQIPKGWATFFYGATKNPLLMDLLNVKYEISYSARIYALRETFLPRAFVVSNCRLLPKKDLLNCLVSPEFDPKKTLLLEEEDNPTDLQVHDGSGETPRSSARIISYRPDEITLEVESEVHGFLFLSELYYPGWKALVDGKPVPILRGNYLFRVIELPRGTHSVQFYYAPLTIKMGIAISLLTLVLITYVAISWFRRSNWLWRR